MLKLDDLYPRKFRIILRFPNWLGDAVMATSILSPLKTHFPESHITVVCKKSCAELLHFHPCVDEIIPFSKETTRLLKNKHFSIGILLPNSFSSAWHFFRLKIDERIGFANDFRSWLLTHSLPFPKERGQEHLVQTYQRLLAPLDISTLNGKPSLFLSSDEKLQGQNSLLKAGISKEQILIGINPGAAYGPAKCWLPERYSQVAQNLLENPRNTLLFFGDRDSISLIDSICKSLGPRAINLAGKTSIRELMSLISLCKVLLTNDSGPMHIAAALGTPLVALFGSTSDKATGPYSHQESVIHKHTSCSPCYLRKCPIDFKCMKQITVDEVLRAVKPII